MTFKEMILDMVEHYKTHPRGIDPEDGGCVYVAREFGSDLYLNPMCQMGRCFVQDVQQQFLDEDDLNNDVSIQDLAHVFHKADWDDLFQDEYRGHSPNEWRTLQGLHDEHHNWAMTADGNQLTSRGISNMLTACSTLTVEDLTC